MAEFPLSRRGRPEDLDFSLRRTASADLKATMHSYIHQWARYLGHTAQQGSSGRWYVSCDHGFIITGDSGLTLAEVAAWLQIEIEIENS